MLKPTPLRSLALLLAVSVLIVGCSPAPDEAAIVVDKLAAGQFDQLGHPQIASDQIAPVRASADRPHQLLVLQVAFAELGFDRYAGAPDAAERNRAYLQQSLFGRDSRGEPNVGTLPHYYRQQSSGRYHIDGTVLPTVTLESPRAEYGRPLRNSDGSWRNDSKPSRLVGAAIAQAYAANPDYNWQQHDIWDPTDFDGDGNRDEPDGYIDHLVVVYAGKGQSSCQGLYKLGQRFTANADESVFASLTADQLACANRIWPHRSSITENLAAGPSLADGQSHRRGGVAVAPGLWLYDYNMQSEYTDVSTFIHEFGHSLGLPDLYASRTNNSTASWDLMSSTSSPQPQALSSWSRMMLGWLEPCVVRPPEFGGAISGSLVQQIMNDPNGSGDCAATMVILPPKIRTLALGPLQPAQGQQAAYTGQGNDLQRTLSRGFDLRGIATGQPVTLSFDSWFDIEADWDYLYIEAAAAGQPFRRLLPLDRSDGDSRSVMPSQKGHEGDGSLPGLTGLSGDLDGDGRVESRADCDPSAERASAEQQIDTSAKRDPCSEPVWVSASFDLSDWRGQTVTVRWHYFTDGAAVNDGALIDNIALPALNYRETFEAADALAAQHGWHNDGYSLSGGDHRLAVPHYLLLEQRDPYAQFDSAPNYDANLAKPGMLFYPDASQHPLPFSALSINYRPGLLVWYYNGEYLWSQNEPSQNGPGNGFLLLLDAQPQEFHLPELNDFYSIDSSGWSGYQFDPDDQVLLAERYTRLACFLRRPNYFPSELVDDYPALCGAGTTPAVESLNFEGRPLRYGYTIINELLPGSARQQYKGASSFYDMQPRGGEPFYRLYDRLLRNRHSADAPFAVQPFNQGLQQWQIGVDSRMALRSSEPFAAVANFDGRHPQRYLNPKLPFGSAALPATPFSFVLRRDAGGALIVDYRWQPREENN